MKQITFSDKQFYDLLQFTSQYVDNIIEKAVDNAETKESSKA